MAFEIGKYYIKYIINKNSQREFYFKNLEAPFKYDNINIIQIIDYREYKTFKRPIIKYLIFGSKIINNDNEEERWEHNLTNYIEISKEEVDKLMIIYAL